MYLTRVSPSRTPILLSSTASHTGWATSVDAFGFFAAETVSFCCKKRQHGFRTLLNVPYYYSSTTMNYNSFTLSTSFDKSKRINQLPTTEASWLTSITVLLSRAAIAKPSLINFKNYKIM